MMKRPTTKLHSVQSTPPANPPSQILVLLSLIQCLPRSMRGSVHQMRVVTLGFRHPEDPTSVTTIGRGELPGASRMCGALGAGQERFARLPAGRLRRSSYGELTSNAVTD